MKVYVITAGSYSDYHIERVFLDKEKAERYVELSNNRYETPYIEEFETDDDEVIEPITFISVNYSKGCSYRENNLDVEINITNTLANKEDDLNRSYFYTYSSLNEKYLSISRVLKGHLDEEKLIKKYEKVAYDLMTQIESLLNMEGWDEKMIRNWLDQNVDNYIKN